MVTYMRYWLILCLALGLAACSGPKPTSGPNNPASATPTAGPLGLRILSPEDNAVVHVPQVEVAGEAPADLVVTINDDIVLVDETGTFSVTLPVEEGPNLIQIVASDAQGNEANVDLVVTYEPEN
jgi:glucodextranase-like protein